jgi:hypothetical protein
MNTIFNIKVSKNREQQQNIPAYWYNHQLVSVIMKHKRQTFIAIYLQRFNTAHKQYRRLSSTIENCKRYKNILLGYCYLIIVFTKHETNIFNGLMLHAFDLFTFSFTD